MSFTYTTNIPFASNSPSVDQPNMETNTNSINSIWAVNHIGFNSANGGTHTKLDFINSQSDPTLSSGTLEVYPKTFGSGTTYLETYTAAKTSAGNQINGYMPFVKAMAYFNTSTGPFPATLSLTSNSINANIASVVQSTSAPGSGNVITITFTTALPYASYFVFLDPIMGYSNISSVTKTTSNVVLRGTFAGGSGITIGIMVI